MFDHVQFALIHGPDIPGSYAILLFTASDLASRLMKRRRLTKHGQEELPHVQGQGQQPRVPGCNSAGTAKRSYPASEVSGGWEELLGIRGQGQWPGGATPRSRSVAARRTHPKSEVRGGGQEELPRVRGQWWPGRDTLRPRPGAVALRSLPEPEARGGSWEEPPTPEARASGWEEQPKERWLCRHRRA